MSVETLLKKINSEIKSLGKELKDSENLVRLQEVLGSYEGEYKLIWSDELKKQIEERPVTPSISLKMPLVDDVTGGFREQQLLTLSAHSKHGKTAFALFLMEKMSELNPVLIPLEQSAEELIRQRTANNQFLPKFLTPERLADRVTVDWIEERVVEGIAKHNTKMVVIDHLGYIDDFGENNRFSRENLAYRIQVVMQQLKAIAKRWNVIVLLLVHISQADESKPPSNQDLKGSSGILQESDKVMFLWRKNTLKNKARIYTNKVMFSITANRFTGRNGNVGLLFESATGNYVEDNGWVESMIKSAEQAIEQDELFDEI